MYMQQVTGSQTHVFGTPSDGTVLRELPARALAAERHALRLRQATSWLCVVHACMLNDASTVAACAKGLVRVVASQQVHRSHGCAIGQVGEMKELVAGLDSNNMLATQRLNARLRRLRAMMPLPAVLQECSSIGKGGVKQHGQLH